MYRYDRQHSNSNDYPPIITVSVDRTSMKKSPTNEFEIITTNSLSSSSISIINSTDDFTPFYSTAIAYSPTNIDNQDRKIYDLI